MYPGLQTHFLTHHLAFAIFRPTEISFLSLTAMVDIARANGEISNGSCMPLTRETDLPGLQTGPDCADSLEVL